jgi:Rrf2 family transcriptional regulator, iron-responsive regulator
LTEYTIDDLVKARPQINFLLGLDEFPPASTPELRAPAA